MRLAIFDVDGTLLQTSAVDDDCYVRAAREVLGLESISVDWGEYPHSTDEVIARTLIERARGRAATREEIDELRDHFVGLLAAERDRDPGLFRSTPGAMDLIDALRANGWAVAIATGGWTPSARLKLEAAGIDWASIPAAYGCDADPREGIIRAAITRASEVHDVDRFTDALYVGDGRWDVAASNALGIGFLGVAVGEREQELRKSGAAVVVPDFAEIDEIVAECDALARPITLEP